MLNCCGFCTPVSSVRKKPGDYNYSNFFYMYRVLKNCTDDVAVITQYITNIVSIAHNVFMSEKSCVSC